MQLIEDLRVTGHFLRFVGNPNDTHRLFEVMRITREGPYHRHSQALTVEHCMRDPEMRRMTQQRYLPADYTKQDLKNCPDGSLGHALLKHLERNGLDIEFYPRMKVEDEITYLVLRLYQQHDFWHVLTGYGASVIDEMALQAFTFAQINSGGNLMIMAAGMLNIGKNSPDEQLLLFEKMIEGYQRGKKARPLLSLAMEDNLQRSLQEIQTELGIESE